MVQGRKEKSRIFKNAVLDQLRVRPMYFSELKEHFNVNKDVLSNALISLKYFGLIEKYFDGENFAKNKMQWVAVKDAPAYHEQLKAVEKKQKDRDETKKSPYATMVVDCNKYHTHGSKNKINPWAGYTSF